jgi:hypothetical protein
MVDGLAHFLNFFIWLNYIICIRVLTPRDLEGTCESV